HRNCPGRLRDAAWPPERRGDRRACSANVPRHPPAGGCLLLDFAAQVHRPPRRASDTRVASPHADDRQRTPWHDSRLAHPHIAALARPLARTASETAVHRPVWRPAVPRFLTLHRSNFVDRITAEVVRSTPSIAPMRSV